MVGGDLTEEVCCACGAVLVPCLDVKGARVAKDQMFSYVQCPGCRSVFLSRRTPQPENIYAEEDYFRRSHSRWGITNVLAGFLGAIGFRSRYFRMEWLPDEEGRILDVGCGAGQWIAFLQNRGLRVEGLDPSGEALSEARRNGVRTVTQGTLTSNPLEPGSYDCITAWHSLEHDADPSKFIYGAHRLLRSGGFLVMCWPNITSWEFERARGNWFHLDPPYHRSFLSQEAAEALFKRAGFSLPQWRYPVLEYCQAALYACFKRRRIPLLWTLLLSPVALILNRWLVFLRKPGVIEVHVRKL